MRPWDSSTVRNLVGLFVVLFCSGLLEQVVAGHVTWRTALVTGLSALIQVARRLMAPDIETGIPMLDRKNTPRSGG